MSTSGLNPTNIKSWLSKLPGKSENFKPTKLSGNDSENSEKLLNTFLGEAGWPEFLKKIPKKV